MRCCRRIWPRCEPGRLLVVGAGKAAAAMAACVEAQLPHTELAGLVITRHGHGLPTRHIEVVEAGHPLPDAAGQAAAQRLRDRCASRARRSGAGADLRWRFQPAESAGCRRNAG
jgi:glycerate-2-kinase